MLGFFGLLETCEYEKARISTYLWTFRASNASVNVFWWYSHVDFTQIPSIFELGILFFSQNPSTNAGDGLVKSEHRQGLWTRQGERFSLRKPLTC